MYGRIKLENGLLVFPNAPLLDLPPSSVKPVRISDETYLRKNWIILTSTVLTDPPL